MSKIREFQKGNRVYLIILVLIVLTSWLSKNLSYIGENPFSGEYWLDNPAQAVFSDRYHYYILDSSYKIAVADDGNSLLYFLEGGSPETTFDYASKVATDDSGNLYVQDKSFAEDGTTAYRERILKFEEGSQKREMLYEVQTVDEDGKQILFLDELKYIDGILYFSEVAEDGIHVRKYVDGNTEECAFMKIENASRAVADSSFNRELEISAVLMNGDIYTLNGTENVLLYDAGEHDTDEYNSLITEISYGDDERLYANDQGLRKVVVFEDGRMSEAITKGFFLDEVPEKLEMAPIYTGLNTDSRGVSVLSEEYAYSEEIDDLDYFYHIGFVSYDGAEKDYVDVLGISNSRRIHILSAYAALLLLIMVSIYAIIHIIRLVKVMGAIQNTTQLLVLITAILVTTGVSVTVFKECNARYIDESVAGLSNMAYLIESRLDRDILRQIDSPDDYFTEDYEALDQSVMDVLKSEVNRASNTYAVLYKVRGNIICEIYRNDSLHGVMTPLAGVYEGSIEENIAAGNRYVSQDYQLSEGSYTFVEIPVFGEQNELLALLEVGTDYKQFVDDNQALFRKLLLLASMAVIIFMLLFSEMLNLITAVRARKSLVKGSTDYAPELIRPVAFMIFFTANITTAFLPIYGMSLCNDSTGLPTEVAAAFPLSAELICSAVAALVCGFLIRKTGVRLMGILGSIFYMGGNLLSPFAPNIWVLVCANSICGIGGGILLITVNTRIAALSGEEKKNRGFIQYNAAFLAGMNCGTVIGSLIWENFGVKSAYLFAVGGAVLILIFVLVFLKNIKPVLEKKEKKERKFTGLRKFITPHMLRYFFCLSLPYLICASFLSYYFPVVADRNMLGASEISMAFLVSGVISIYIGTAVGEPVMEKLGARRSMILASFIYAAALGYLVLNPSIFNCYVVIVLFAVADSFGLAAQSVYFAAMPEVNEIGQSRALGINSTAESITSACGSLIFGSALLLGEQRGILVILLVFVILLFLYVVMDRKSVIPEQNSSS